MRATSASRTPSLPHLGHRPHSCGITRPAPTAPSPTIPSSRQTVPSRGSVPASCTASASIPSQLRRSCHRIHPLTDQATTSRPPRSESLSSFHPALCPASPSPSNTTRGSTAATQVQPSPPSSTIRLCAESAPVRRCAQRASRTLTSSCITTSAVMRSR